MKCIVFDLDGTLISSRSMIEPMMVERLQRLLDVHDVAIVSGEAWALFQECLLSNVELTKKQASRLYLFPTNATSLYVNVDDKWLMIYAETLTADERSKIVAAIKQALNDAQFVNPKRTWGSQFDDRGTQVTFSALGQAAPISHKSTWDPTFEKRFNIVEKLLRSLPEYEIRVGGMTSIDVMKKGIDKLHAIEYVKKHLGIVEGEMIYVSDAQTTATTIDAIKKSGIKTIMVTDVSATASFIDGLLSTT